MKNDIVNYIDIARFYSIYAVVLGHFHPFIGIDNEIGRQIIYMFHMPIFFIISGMLSKPSSISKTFCALIIPYILYNIISIVKLDFKSLITIDALELTNSPTWFFVVLFIVKILADLLCRLFDVVYI